MTITRVQRFFDKVLITESCWLWTAAHKELGYGKFWNGEWLEAAHRYSYRLIVGPIPDGFQLDHLCRNPPCVNPDHLEPVTPYENTRRGNAGKLQLTRTHCPRGHEYRGTNRDGKRRCKLCRNALARARYHGISEDQIPVEWWQEAVNMRYDVRGLM